MKSEVVLNKIKRYAGLGKLSVFVGAGVSKLSGYPSWSSLVQRMADEMEYSYTQHPEGYAIFSSEELLKIPQMYYLKFGEEKYKDEVQTAFKNSCLPNEVHDLILSLKPNHLLTTNYDTLLEDAATKFGRNFSILNSNQVVSQAETLNYIVKVHGDFSAKYVLKEQDYLDYENDYILIDNIVKTIFATNLVIFVGYGLNDYNIKLILNWVKRVQSSSHVPPVFIHTGETLSQTELIYQNGRGLEILDCNDYTSSPDYKTKYSSVLKYILQFSNTPHLANIECTVKYIHNKIAGVKNLVYIRREDFNSIFAGDYILDDSWYIKNININQSISFDENEKMIEHTEYRVSYWEDFFAHEEDCKITDSNAYNDIKQFISRVGINGLFNENTLHYPSISIDNLAFTNQYEKMYEFCEVEYTEISDKYKKAYFLAQLGEYDKSYMCYTEIISLAKQLEQWDIYFFSQINRHYLYSIITQRQYQSTGFQGAINFGKELHIFDDRFLEQLKCEMQNNTLESQFSDLPYEFKRDYSTLAAFSKRNCYIDKYYELAKEKYKVEKSLQKDTAYFGLSQFDKIKLSMLETSKFISDNMILFDGFDENKLFIKNSLISWLDAYCKEVTKNSSSAFGFISNARCKFTLVDIMLISKNFQKDDLLYLSNKFDFSQIPFDEVEGLEKYVSRQLCNYTKMFTTTLTGGEIFLWKLYSEEIRNLLFMTSYFLLDDKFKKDIVDFVVNMADGHYSVDDRIRLIIKYISSSNGQDIYQILEIWLANKVENLLQDIVSPIPIDNAARDIAIIAQLMSNVSTDKSDMVSQVIVNYKEKAILLKGCFEQILLIANDETKRILESMNSIENIFQLMSLGYKNLIPNGFDEIEIIKNFFKRILDARKENHIAGIARHTIPSDEDNIGRIAAYMLTKDFPEDFINKYWDICPEYTFLLCPLRFNKEHFSVGWLSTYSDTIYEQLRNCPTQKLIILEAIESILEDESIDLAQYKRLFAIYRTMTRA